MTGHGAAISQSDLVEVLAEVRSVNNRFLKVTVSGDLNGENQARLEAMVRQRIQRGAVNARIQIQFVGGVSPFQINVAQVLAYSEQLSEARLTAAMGSILLLPGVVSEVVEDTRMQQAWPTIETAMSQALDKFVEMRAREGQTMLDDLLCHCDLISQRAAQIRVIGPTVVDGYSKRITERINRMLLEHQVAVTTSELIREVGVFAERVDISEELVRLDSHTDQFRTIANGSISDGRKLEFLTQELLRETNTIGSKANDAKIATHVIEMKAAIEKIREMIHNIE